MADIVSNILSGMHIAANLADYEAARSGFFTFLVTGGDTPDADGKTFRNKLYARTNTVFKSKIQEANLLDNLALNITSSSVPQFSVGTLEYKRGNDTIKMAGMATFGEGSIKVDDVVGLDTKSILMAWKELAYDPITRKTGRMKDYKVDCTLCEYTQDFELIRSWKLYGCWISQLDDAEFNRESDEKRSITATIQYDRAIMEMPTA